MAQNENKVTLSSEKIYDHEQLTCPTMHSQYHNTDINKEDNDALNLRKTMVEFASEIESGNGNNAAITIDYYVPSKDKLQVIMTCGTIKRLIIASR